MTKHLESKDLWELPRVLRDDFSPHDLVQFVASLDRVVDDEIFSENLRQALRENDIMRRRGRQRILSSR